MPVEMVPLVGTEGTEETVETEALLFAVICMSIPERLWFKVDTVAPAETVEMVAPEEEEEMARMPSAVMQISTSSMFGAEMVATVQTVVTAEMAVMEELLEV